MSQPGSLFTTEQPGPASVHRHGVFSHYQKLIGPRGRAGPQPEPEPSVEPPQINAFIPMPSEGFTPDPPRMLPPAPLPASIGFARGQFEADEESNINRQTQPKSIPGSLVPPIVNRGMMTPGGAGPGNFYDTDRPTCSLTVVCYRYGATGCVMRQVSTVLASRFGDPESFRKAVEKNPILIYTDTRFFLELRRMYSTEMCGFWRRYFSLKSLRGMRLLVVRMIVCSVLPAGRSLNKSGPAINHFFPLITCTFSCKKNYQK